MPMRFSSPFFQIFFQIFHTVFILDIPLAARVYLFLQDMYLVFQLLFL